MSKVPSQATRANQVGMSKGILVSIATVHKGVMSIAPHPATFDSLLCRYPSELGGLVKGKVLPYSLPSIGPVGDF